VKPSSGFHPVTWEHVNSQDVTSQWNKVLLGGNEAVLLELEFINWTFSELLSKGFVPLSTPDLVRSTVVEKCGF